VNIELCTLRAARQIIGHFGDESFQTISCTNTDNETQSKRKQKDNHKTKKLALNKKKHAKTTQKPSLNQ